MKLSHPKQPCCPKCDGTEGVEVEMTVKHTMNGAWGDALSSADSMDTRFSLARCLDCGAQFRYDSLQAKGLVQ